ncbi:MAG: 2-C-methyl-D-erythritol 4-phosphate cytidylyltransferase [Chloroflexota bacterium]|nr:2-C-methyl-D-erythritol 4-phosphate cytidylyltransferase [Chloroflexota bacterium]
MSTTQTNGEQPRERVTAIIVAAGAGLRMGGIDKLFADVGGMPLLARTLAAFEACPSVDQIILVASESNLDRCWKLVRSYGFKKVTELVPGGARRQDSVQQGLDQVKDSLWVLIHDGVRPFIDDALITAGIKTAREYGASVAAVPVKDTIKVVNADHLVRNTPKRGTLWAAQTPQVFRIDVIRAAYRDAFGDVTDDAMLLERIGQPVKVYQGSYENIKITTPEDLDLAECILKRRGK